MAGDRLAPKTLPLSALRLSCCGVPGQGAAGIHGLP